MGRGEGRVAGGRGSKDRHRPSMHWLRGITKSAWGGGRRGGNLLLGENCRASERLKFGVKKTELKSGAWLQEVR